MTKIISLKNLHEATEQEVFDQVAKHLLTQNKQSFGDTEGVQCCYRGLNGLKCAAGTLISNDEYIEQMEGNTWEMLLNLKLVPEHHFNLISDLQRIHDCNNPYFWLSDLKDFAKERNLSFNFNVEQV